MSLLLLVNTSVTGMLLSDLPTPCLVLGVPLLQKHITDATTDSGASLPPLQFPSNSALLIPHDPVSHLDIDVTAPPMPLVPDSAYIHCQVTRGKDHVKDPVAFLAQLDVPTNLQDVTQLVLGLNNHHVGSYYWARSAGAGAAMEAPGVMITSSSVMQWQKEEGYIACNSNDGKRSEWVNFLRKGDMVQLLLLSSRVTISDKEAAIIQGLPVFGVSYKGRPLGSEPEVVCKWKWE